MPIKQLTGGLGALFKGARWRRASFLKAAALVLYLPPHAAALEPGWQVAPAAPVLLPTGQEQKATPLDITALPWTGLLTAPPLPLNALTPPDNIDLAYGAFQHEQYDLALRHAVGRAEQGDAAAQTLLGLLYESGLSVEPDLTRAAQWFEIAAHQGDPEAQYLFGLMLLEGRGVAADKSRAATWFDRAAAQGHGTAQYNAGVLLLQGEVRRYDPMRAVELFQKSADQDVADAQYALGVSYLQGSGVLASDIEAAKWLQKAAENQHLDAQVEFAILRFQGRGIAANEREAAAWFSRAANRGNAIAMNRLARLLVAGRGLSADPIEAMKWHLLASSAGLRDVKLDDEMRLLSLKSRAEAERRAALWLQDNRDTPLRPIAPLY